MPWTPFPPALPPRLRRVAPTLAAVLLGALLLTSCTAAGAAHTNGTIRVGSTTDLNPPTFYAGQATHTGLVFDTLTSYGPDGLDPQPELAQSWDISEDGLRATLDLREGITFHDGSEFTSGDVEFSLRNYSDPTQAGQLARVAQAISGYDTSEPHRITLNLSHPVNNLFDLFSIVPIIDRDTVEQLRSGESYNGTGPFRFVEWSPGSHARYEANPDYWAGTPLVDGVEVLVVPDQQTQLSQLRAGQLDLIAASPRDAESLQDDPDFRVVPLTGTAGITYVGANVTEPGLADPRVREAISLAVDRDRILEEVYRGRGRASALPWPTYSPAYDPDADQSRRDLDRARQLVEEVAADERIPELPITVPATSLPLRATAQIVADNLREIGIPTRIDPVDISTTTNHLINGTYPGLWIYSHTFAQYHPSTLVTAAFPFNSEKNASNFHDEGYSLHATQAWQLPDPDGEEAQAVYRELNRDLLEHNFLIELALPETEVLTAGNLEGVSWDKRGLYDLSGAHFTD